MSRRPPSFIDQVLSGHAGVDQIDDFIEAWHEGDGSVALHDHLGMTMDEYALWVSDPDALAAIAQARRDHTPLFAAVR